MFILSFSAVTGLDFPAPPATLDWTPPGSSSLLYLSTTEPQHSLVQFICLADGSKSPFLVGISLPWHRALHSSSFSCSLSRINMNYWCAPNTRPLSLLCPAKWEISLYLSHLMSFIFIFEEKGWDGNTVHISSDCVTQLWSFCSLHSRLRLLFAVFSPVFIFSSELWPRAVCVQQWCLALWAHSLGCTAQLVSEMLLRDNPDFLTEIKPSANGQPPGVHVKVGRILIPQETLVFTLTHDLQCVFHVLCLWAFRQGQEDCSGNSPCS